MAAVGLTTSEELEGICSLMDALEGDHKEPRIFEITAAECGTTNGLLVQRGQRCTSAATGVPGMRAKLRALGERFRDFARRAVCEVFWPPHPWELAACRDPVVGWCPRSLHVRMAVWLQEVVQSNPRPMLAHSFCRLTAYPSFLS